MRYLKGLSMIWIGGFLTLFLFVGIAHAFGDSHAAQVVPLPLDRYQDSTMSGVSEILLHRIAADPLNLVASIIFLLAIIHTFLSSRFQALAHRWERQIAEMELAGSKQQNRVHLGVGLVHFMGEVEVIFGLWTVVLGGAIVYFYDWDSLTAYTRQVNYTEPMFVVVIMALAATRPILKLVELILWKIANRLGGSLAAWWFTILTMGPLLGSLITEAAAMTISALLLAEKFFELQPSTRFKYATVGLLFVNVSVGGTMTNFSAPPILMVAAQWDWDMTFMSLQFGWKAILGMLLANGIYFYRFRSELASLEFNYKNVQEMRFYQRKYVDRDLLAQQLDVLRGKVDQAVGFTHRLEESSHEIQAELTENAKKDVMEEQPDFPMEEAIAQRFEMVHQQEMIKSLPGLLPAQERPAFRDPDWDTREDRVPGWMMIIHGGFLFWTVINAHNPALFIGGFLFFLGFAQVTGPFQNRIDLKPPLLVGFFLAGLVLHGGMQAWWIAPVLGNLSDQALMVTATVLTSFNDNAAIAYLSTFITQITPSMKYAIIAGAVTGGGLTVIANAPNPAGQSILKRYFKHGISPLWLLKEALPPTLILGCCFWFLRF